MHLVYSVVMTARKSENYLGFSELNFLYNNITTQQLKIKSAYCDLRIHKMCTALQFIWNVPIKCSTIRYVILYR